MFYGGLCFAPLPYEPTQKLPDGQITQNLSSPIAKNIPLVASGKSVV
jgi:hypothetical protein